MTTKDKRVGWLRDLKVGDLVLVRSGGPLYSTVHGPYPVTGITPIGIMTVNGYQYRPRYQANLLPVTPEALADIRWIKLKGVVESWAHPNLWQHKPSLCDAPLEMLEQVAVLIDKYQPTDAKE